MSVYKSQISDQLQGRGQFAQIPNEIYQVDEFSNTARSIWIYLASEGPGWKGSYPNIARNMGLSTPTVRTAIQELVTKNMLIASPHAEGCDFELISSDKWVVKLKEKPVKKHPTSQQKALIAASKDSLLAPMQPIGCIQEDPKLSNTTNTLKAKAFKSGKKEVSSKEKDLKPTYPQWPDDLFN